MPRTAKIEEGRAESTEELRRGEKLINHCFASGYSLAPGAAATPLTSPIPVVAQIKRWFKRRNVARGRSVSGSWEGPLPDVKKYVSVLRIEKIFQVAASMSD